MPPTDENVVNGKSMKWVCQVAVLLLVISALAFFSVPEFGAIWHLLNGNSIDCWEWRLPVPGRFFVSKGERGPMMWKLGFGTPFFEEPYGLIAIFHLPRDRKPFAYSTDFQGFSNGISQAAADSGYRFISNRKTNAGKNTAYCLEFSHSNDEHQMLARCSVENASIFLFYEGNDRYLPDFYSMLNGMYPRN